MKNIRRMKSEDIPRVAEIHIFGWRAAYRGIVSDETLFNERTVAASLPKWSERMKSGETYVYDDGIVKAFITIGACRDEDKPDAFELGGIYVEPLMKRQGIGAELINFCESQARGRGYDEIVIWVFKENAPSRKFYEAMGFKTDGTTKVHERHGGAPEVRYIKNL